MEEEHVSFDDLAVSVAGENHKLIPSSSADKVASNVDLLTEILLRLPVRCIIRSKVVSKHWYSVITNPSFPPQFYKHNPNLLNPPPSGLFFPKTSLREKNVDYEFVSLDVDNPVKKPPFELYPPKVIKPPFVIYRKPKSEPPECPFMTKLGLYPPKGDIEILQSSNGLMLFRCCWNPPEPKPYSYNPFEHYKYYIYNPTTKKFNCIESLKTPHRVTLVFDPKKSPHYKLVCLLIRKSICWLEVYSSETHTWKASSKTISRSVFLSKNGVYWNDALHWVDIGVEFWYLKLDDESVHETRVPQFHGGVRGGNRLNNYLVESCDCLLYIDNLYPTPERFNVYEMKRDYSGWNVKYQVDLSELREWGPNYWCQFVIHTVVLGQREEDSFLVIQIMGKAIKYNLVSRTSQKLCDLTGVGSRYTDLRYFSCGTAPMPGFLFMESLFPVGG